MTKLIYRESGVSVENPKEAVEAVQPVLRKVLEGFGYITKEGRKMTEHVRLDKRLEATFVSRDGLRLVQNIGYITGTDQITESYVRAMKPTIRDLKTFNHLDPEYERRVYKMVDRGIQEDKYTVTYEEV